MVICEVMGSLSDIWGIREWVTIVIFEGTSGNGGTCGT